MKAKNQHYVPQFILRNFVSGKKKHIHVYDKIESKTFNLKVSNIASENYFYDIDRAGIKSSLEPSLTEMEDKASRVIENILVKKNIQFLTEEDKSLLAFFTALQFTRTRRHKENYFYFHRQLEEHVKKSGHRLDQVKGYEPINEDRAKELHFQSITEDVPEFSDFISAKDLLLFEAPQSSLFYISDHPVNLHNDNDFGPYGKLGLAVKGIQIFFPISSKYALCYWCPSIGNSIKKSYQQIFNIMKNNPRELSKMDLSQILKLHESLTDGKPFLCDDENVIHHNSIQAFQSHRFIFSQDGQFDLFKKMNQSGDLKKDTSISL